MALAPMKNHLRPKMSERRPDKVKVIVWVRIKTRMTQVIEMLGPSQVLVRHFHGLRNQSLPISALMIGSTLATITKPNKHEL